MPTFNISTFFNLKYPESMNRRVCYILIGSLVFFSQTVLFSLSLFNPILNENATYK